MSATALLQLHQRESLERNLSRAALAGGAAGALHLVLHRLGSWVAYLVGGVALPFPASESYQWAPLSVLAIIAAAAASIHAGHRMHRALLWAAAFTAPIAPWTFGLTAPWAVALSGAAGGLVMVRAHLCDRGDDRQVATGRAGWINYALGAGLCGTLALMGTATAHVLGARLALFSTPSLVICMLAGAAIALFTTLGSIAGHLALRPDPVEARCEELLPRLDGELRVLASRALDLYRHCGRALAALPREPAREELARTLSRATNDAVELASEWSALEEQLDVGGVKRLQDEQVALQKSALAAKDPLAKRQLEFTAASLQEEMERLELLKLRRERIVAKLKSEVVLLDRARLSLIGMRSGHVQIKAAALSALARKLSALSDAQSDEARIADEVATHAELDQQDAHALEARAQTCS